MKCPYNPTEFYQEVIGEPIYRRIEIEGADGEPDYLHLTNNGRSSVVTYKLSDCLMSGCGAWQDGKCSRRA